MKHCYNGKNGLRRSDQKALRHHLNNQLAPCEHEARYIIHGHCVLCSNGRVLLPGQERTSDNPNT